jgi:hypothetical protein
MVIEINSGGNENSQIVILMRIPLLSSASSQNKKCFQHTHCTLLYSTIGQGLATPGCKQLTLNRTYLAPLSTYHKHN